MSTHGGSSFPIPDTLFGRGHRVSRSLFRSFVRSFLCSGRSSPRSFIPVLRPFVPYSQIITPSPPSGKEASLTLGIIYTITFNTLVRGMPVLRSRNILNLISTERGGTKTLLELLTMRRGPSLVCLVRASFLSYVPFVSP